LPATGRASKKGPGQGASLALIDQSGLLMAPLVRHTGAPRGQTPVWVQKSGPREKVSVAAALWVAPRRDRLGLSSGTSVHGYFDNWHSAAFLEAWLQELTGRLLVLCDGGPMHHGDAIRDLVEQLRLARRDPTRPARRDPNSMSTWSLN
jgi:hypothetical protein